VVLTALPAVVAAVSDLALIIVAAPDMSFERGGMSPQCISQRGRPGWKPANTTPIFPHVSSFPSTAVLLQKRLRQDIRNDRLGAARWVRTESPSPSLGPSIDFNFGWRRPTRSHLHRCLA